MKFSRTTTLNDIYRNMEMEKNFHSNSIDEAKTSVNRQDHFIEDGIEDEYEEGEVSGYVVQKPLLHGGINSFNPHAVSIAITQIIQSVVCIKIKKFLFQNVMQADAKSGNAFYFFFD